MMIMPPDQHLCESKTFILKAIDQLESSVIQYFRLSEKMIEASYVIHSDQDQDYETSLFKTACCLRSFFSYLIELQEILMKKKTVILYTISREDILQQPQFSVFHQNSIQHQEAVKACLESNIKSIITHYAWFKDIYIMKEQLEEFLHYYKLKKNMLNVYFEEEMYPEPSPPLLNIAKGSYKRRTDTQR
ncbi:hypothetical protein CR194_10070 [Salipaludibacillus keqinensis]|uniref:Uncharacterized protein n=1 Tax=Salipaludibacillus keqinensis TaxID=2045207 RepID=A0A323TGV0_9BACI|nr:hypothetical protein CR194_10070 [Salipaludibacillus keqinensis]